jgi:tetratricopeptide (TPR) repeat protein
MPKHQPAKGRRWLATLIVTSCFVAVAGAAALGWWYARESPPHQGPIVLISVDGLPTDALAAYGGASTGMPAIDALAKDSVVFERAYSHSPQVLPAHASLLSGELPPEHGVRDDAGFVLNPDIRTMPKLLRSRGFNTGAALSSMFLRRESGVAQGFTFFANGSGASSAEDSGTTVVDAAERWARTQDQRYFLLVEVEPRDAETAVARLTSLLKERRLYNNATIILVGGRGRPGGTSLDEPTLHVPLLIKEPRSESAGRRVTALVQHIDLLPTILDFVRAPIPGGLQGRSLRRAIDGNAPVPSQAIYSESLAGYYRFGTPPVFALTTDRYRFVRGADDQMMPLTPDAVAGDAAPLRATLDRLIANHPLPPPAPIPPADEEPLALAGYLRGLPPASGIQPAIGAGVEDTITEAYRTAAVQAGERMFSNAVTTLRTIVRDHPTLASVHYQLGLVLARSGRLDEAVTPLKAAGDLRPDAVEIPLALADIQLRAGRAEAAQEQIERAIAIAEEAGGGQPLADAHALAARIALARHDTAAATSHADAALAANPGLPMPQFVRGRLAYEADDDDAALMAFREAAAITREHGTSIADLHVSIGEALARQEQYSEAETEMREELDAFPRNIHTYCSLAMLYHAAGRDEDVEGVINELLAAAPSPEGYALAAKTWSALGEAARADALRSDARARFRGDPSLALLGRDARR